MSDVIRTNVEIEVGSIKCLRRDLDAAIQRVRALTPNRETSLVVTKLQEAVMWLGMDLKGISEAHPGQFTDPYPKSKDPTSPVIEPTADGLEL